MTYYVRDPKTNKDVQFYRIDDARKFAYNLVDKGIRKSVTIRNGNRVEGKVYLLGYGIVYKGMDYYYRSYRSATWVILPDGTISHEYDGTW